MLTAHDAAVIVDDLRFPPEGHLEELKDDWAGQHPVRTNGQWRVCFVWTANDLPRDFPPSAIRARPNLLWCPTGLRSRLDESSVAGQSAKDMRSLCCRLSGEVPRNRKFAAQNLLVRQES